MSVAPKKNKSDSLSEEELQQIADDAIADVDEDEWADDTVTDVQAATSEPTDPTIAGDSASEDQVTSIQRPPKLASSPNSSKESTD